MKNKLAFIRTSFLFFFISLSQLAFNQAPNWIWNSPFAVIPSSVGGTGLSVYAMLDRPGTIYYEVLAHGAPKPSIANIVAGQDSSGFPATLPGNMSISSSDYKSGYKNIELKPLSASTEYDVYLVAKDTAASPHFQAVSTKLDLTTTTGSGLTYWNGDFELWNDSLTVPLYYYNWRQTLPNPTYQTYTKATGESGTGYKTTVTNTNLTNKLILDMQEDPLAYGLSNGIKYHISLRIKANRANVFSVAFKSCGYFIDFGTGSGSPTLSPADTLKSTNWETFSYDFTMAVANRFKTRWNINKMSGVQVGDNVTIDNFYIKNATEAPLWWNGNPSISNVQFNKFDLSLSLDEPGLISYVVVPKDAPAPSVSEVIAGTASGGGTAISIGTIDASIGFNTYSATITGLIESKNYDVYLVAQNKESSPTAQASVTKLTVLTTAFPGPFAHAGGNIWAISSYQVTLDGTGSIGSNLTYSWTAPGAISLSSNTTSKPTFTAPVVVDTVVYPVILVVNDGVNDSYPDTAYIHLVQDYIPIANGGVNKTVDPNTNISLDGTQSHDPNGKSLTYSWIIPNGITVNKTDTAIIDFHTPSPDFTSNFEFILVVNDGKLNSTADTVVLTVNKFNRAPSADAGNGRTVDPGTTVILDGSTSTDPNNDNLSFHWTVPSEMPVANADTDIISFTATSPDVKTSYYFILVVNDGLLDSQPDTLVLTVNAIHHKPKADAGSDQTVNPGDQVVLTGSYTADSTGFAPAYSWIIPNGITVNKTDTSVIVFTAPSPANTTVYPFILAVNDGVLNSDPDTVEITVLGSSSVHSISTTGIQLYPNPVANFLNIKLPGSWSYNASVKIYNALGSLYINREMNGHESQFDLASLPTGVYIVEIKDGVHSVSRKLIKR